MVSDARSGLSKKEGAEKAISVALAVLRAANRELDAWEALHLAEALTAYAGELWLLAAVLAQSALLEEALRAEGWRDEVAPLSFAEIEASFEEILRGVDAPGS